MIASFPNEGWIAVQVAPQVSGQKHRLHKGQESHFHLFTQKRMLDFFLLPFLVSHQHLFACSVIHEDGPGFGLLKPLTSNLLEVHEGKGQAISEYRPEFLHEVEGQAGAARAVPVEVADRRIEPYRLERGGYVMRQEGIEKRKQSIQIVERRTAAAFMEEEVFFLRRNEMIEYLEVGAGRVSFHSAHRVEG